MPRVMVVDDEREYADLLASRLQTRNFQTAVAYSGEEALETIQKFQPAVILLDVNMPGMGGLATLRHIKERSPQTEIILLTADNALDTAITGMKFGARDYLLKPVEIETVVQAIRRAKDEGSRRLQRQRLTQTAKLAALGVMATGVGHEINNPIQVILNETEWIEELLEEKELKNLAASKEIKQATRRIKEQSLRCKDITAKLLSLRHSSASPDNAKTAVDKLFGRLLNACQEQMEKLRVRCKTDIAPEIFLGGSPSEWEQVFGNLLENALDAMQTKGGELVIHAQKKDQKAVIHIQDTGCGIEPKLQSKIFDPFFSTKDVGQGTGLGLTVCHGIVEAAGGEIALHSVAGAGSSFELTIPLYREPISKNGEIL